MHEMVIKNADRYIWFGDQRKLDVRTMNGHIYRFYKVVDFESKLSDNVYSRETEQLVHVRFEDNAYICDEAWVYAVTTNSVLTTKKENNMNEIVIKKKSIEEIAKDVLAGKWGTGVDRIKNLEEAGYNYNEVQGEVNRMLFRYSNVPKREGSKIKNVIFNDTATIVFWSDGTKTVVKCGENDIYDPEKGLAMAVAKKYLGTNKSHSNYMDEFKKWLPKEEETSDPFEDFRDSLKKLAEIGSSLKEKEHD